MSGRRARRDRTHQRDQRVDSVFEALDLPPWVRRAAAQSLIIFDWVRTYGLHDPLLQPVCPACSDGGAWLIGGGLVGQVFCSNDDCAVWMWDARQELGGPEATRIVETDEHGGTHIRWELAAEQ